MPSELSLSLGTLYGFLLVLARVAGIFALVPLPGLRMTPEPARAALVFGLTLALFPRWPHLGNDPAGAGQLLAWALGETVAGLATGIAVAVVVEAFSLGAQVLGLQAGYAYASTIDPNTQADSGLLLVLAETTAGLLFFAIGLDREVVRHVAQSLDSAPPGTFTFTAHSGQQLIRCSGLLFSVGLRLALPVVALLIMADLALALLGRINSQLQLLSLAFPVKMLATLIILSAGVAIWPRVMRELGTAALQTLRNLPGL